MDTHTADVAKQRAAEYVRYWREIAGMTPVQLAEASGVSRSKLYDIEEGRGALAKPETLSSVAKAIGRDPSEILAIIGRDMPEAVTQGSSSEAILEQLAADLKQVLANQERMGTLVVTIAEQIERGELEVRRPQTRKRPGARSEHPSSPR